MPSLKKTYELISLARIEVLSVAQKSLEAQEYELVREASYLAGDIDKMLERGKAVSMIPSIIEEEEFKQTLENTLEVDAIKDSPGIAEKKNRPPTSKKKGKASLKKLSTSKRNNNDSIDSSYPKFKVEHSSLIKTGWSKQKNAEYSHKAPVVLVEFMTQRLEAYRAKNEMFSMEKILPVSNPDTGTDFPSYQSYLALAFLLSIGYSKKHGRDGYSISQDVTGPDFVVEKLNEIKL